MEEKINYREELASIRESLKGVEKPYSNEALELFDKLSYFFQQ